MCNWEIILIKLSVLCCKGNWLGKMANPRAEYRKDKRIGKGTNGSVYRATSPGGTGVAIKCNMKYKDQDGCASIRELSITHVLSRHPYIINISKIAFGEPFTNGMISPRMSPNCSDMQMDRLHFVLPLGVSDFRNYFRDNFATLTMHDVKRFMVEILLGVEYIHGLGIIHRDIKEDNIVVVKDKDGVARMRIGDFGHAKPYARYMKNTGGIVTSWWRPPEILLGSNTYTQLADMWSVGCIFYTMISGKPLTGAVTDNNLLLVNAIVASLPYHVSATDIRSMNYSGLKVQYKAGIISMESFLGISAKGVEDMDIVGGYANFTSMLMGMLSFNESNRKTATETLNHTFFNDCRDHINEVRALYPPVERPQPKVIVHACSERTWGLSLALGAYQNRSKFKSWYTDRILIHSIAFFDLAITHLIPTSNYSIIPNHVTGRMLTKKNSELLYLSCLYFSIKYFSSIQAAVAYSTIASAQHCLPEDILLVDRYEEMLYMSVLKYDVYRDTVYDILCKNRAPTQDDVSSILLMMLNGHHSGCFSGYPEGITPSDAYKFMWLPNRDRYMLLK
jgi:serine/threonine protein kinase